MADNVNNSYDSAVMAIKSAVEKSRYRAAKAGNAELLSLYFGIGKFVSINTRNGFWGTDAIKKISYELKRELNGVRGFSESNIKNMRQFYEEWCPYVNRQPSAGDLEVDSEYLLKEVRQPRAGDLNWSEFIAVSFSHHMEIIAKTETIDERIFYIHECATRLGINIHCVIILNPVSIKIEKIFLTILTQHCLTGSSR